MRGCGESVCGESVWGESVCGECVRGDEEDLADLGSGLLLEINGRNAK